MRPIVYESHCQACHPLNFKPPRESLDEPDASEVIPHRLTSKQIGQFLERAYSALILKQDPSLWDRVVVPPRELPGKPAIEEDVTVRTPAGAGDQPGFVPFARGLLEVPQTCGSESLSGG